MTPIIDAYRAVLLDGRAAVRRPFRVAPRRVACVVLVVGWLVFHRAEFQFAENV